MNSKEMATEVGGRISKGKFDIDTECGKHGTYGWILHITPQNNHKKYLHLTWVIADENAGYVILLFKEDVFTLSFPASPNPLYPVCIDIQDGKKWSITVQKKIDPQPTENPSGNDCHQPNKNAVTSSFVFGKDTNPSITINAVEDDNPILL